jgi:hypothetical protein
MSGVLNPLSPDQAKAQVIDAARDVASTLDDLPILKASVRLESCNDDSSPAYPEGPYRGSLLLQYPPTSSRSAGRSAIDGYIQRLLHGEPSHEQASSWSSRPPAAVSRTAKWTSSANAATSPPPGKPGATQNLSTSVEGAGAERIPARPGDDSAPPKRDSHSYLGRAIYEGGKKPLFSAACVRPARLCQ